VLGLLLLRLRLRLRPRLRILLLPIASRTCGIGIVLECGVRGSWRSSSSNHDCPFLVRISLGRCSGLLTGIPPSTSAQARIRRRRTCAQRHALKIGFEHLRSMLVDAVDSIMAQTIILLLPDLIVPALRGLGR